MGISIPKSTWGDQVAYVNYPWSAVYLKDLRQTLDLGQFREEILSPQEVERMGIPVDLHCFVKNPYTRVIKVSNRWSTRLQTIPYCLDPGHMYENRSLLAAIFVHLYIRPRPVRSSEFFILVHFLTVAIINIHRLIT